MPRFFAHLRRFIVRGALALIPIALPAIAIYLLYDFIDRRIVVLVERFLHVSFPGLGIVLLLLVLYLFGLVASNIFGRRILEGVEGLTERIPIVKAIYRMGKQLSGTLAQSADSSLFRRPVLVPYAYPNQWQIGFITGSVRSESTGETLLRVFVPTPPNPATGMVYLILESNVRDPGWTVEETMQCLLSGGIIGPEMIR
ncbi:MAG TPA: DUF502 domain-containing protein [Candidatus Krumholzibacteria bacterium]|nr:DUF502 domain-containing protein [Candidatus Krumholzibacteria bacterium]